MDKSLTKILTDTVIITAFIGFSYCVLMLYKLAYFGTFGLTSFAGLISLDFQSVFQAMMYTAVLALYTVGTFVLIMKLRFWALGKLKPKTMRVLIKIVLGLTLGLVMIAPASILLLVVLPNHTKIILVSTVLVAVLLAIILEAPSRVSSVKRPAGGIRKFIEGLGERARMPVLLLALFAMLTLVYSLVAGTLTPMVAKDLKGMTHGDKKYVVIDQTPSRIVLAELQGNRVMSNYKYLNLPDDSVVEIYDIDQRLDFSFVSELSERKLNI